MEAAPLDWKRAAAPGWITTSWPLVAGILVLAVPTLITMARQHWSTEAGAHAPLVLATGAWLVWRRLQLFEAEGTCGRFGLTLAVLLPSLLIYIFGRAFDYLSLEAAGLYGAVIAAIYDRWGARLLQHLWFPLLYLGFAIPVPGWLLDYATAPLKEFASMVTTQTLQFFGIPIVREGVILFVAQYQLLVEDACAGLNAIMGLTSLGLFYAYLSHGSSWRYALLLTAFILPIAVAANIIRITILVLITLWAGNDAAQGYLHGTAGLVMFASALLLVFMVDSVLSRIYRPREAQ